MRKLFEIMEICSNICSLRDAPISRPFSVSATVAGQKFAQYIGMLYPGRFILIESVLTVCAGHFDLEEALPKLKRS